VKPKRKTTGEKTMNATITATTPARNINGKDIPLRQVFMGSIGAYKNRLFIRLYNNIIGIDYRGGTWQIDAPVTDYAPVIIEL
jgi:hypothetical protein